MMHDLKNLFWVMLIGMYVYVCIWIYYNTQLTVMDEISDESNELNEDELIFAYVVIRHGSRSPKHTYKKDPYGDASYWPEGLNQLTKEGKQTQFELGEFMRRRYDKLLGRGDYSPKNVYIQSTDEDRCLVSAQCNAAGLWYSVTNQWQPVPIHVVRDQRNCHEVKQMGEKYLESDEIKALLVKHRRLCKFLEVHSGNRVKTVDDFINLNDVLNVEHSNGFLLPEWVDRVLNKSRDIMELFTAIKYESFTHTTPMKKIKGGFFIKEIFDRLKNRTLGATKPNNMILYFTHGHAVVNILNTLNVYELHIPPFSSSIHLELYRRADGEHYVQLFYKRNNSEHLPLVEFPNCGTTKCPLDKLYQLYSDVLPNENDTLKSLCHSLQ